MTGDKLKFCLVGCHVEFHPTHTTGENVTKSHCILVSVTKNHRNRISAYSWMFVETSSECILLKQVNK